MGALTSFCEGAGPRIYCDSREDGALIEALRARGGVEVVVRPLPTDYVVEGTRGKVAIERKTLQDFLSSVSSGRLWDQLRALKQLEGEGYKPMLLLGGPWWKVLKFRSWQVGSVMGAISAVSLAWEVPVLHFDSKELTVGFLHQLAMYVGRPREEGLHPLRPVKGAMTPAEQARCVVEGLPGVSSALADRLLAKFKTVRALANASPEALMEVDGIGPKRAEAIHRTFNVEYEARQQTGDRAAG